MKNRHASILVLITCVFASFTLGFLLGRSGAPGDVIVAMVPKDTGPVISQQETAETVPASLSAEATVQEDSQSGRININTATLAQLDSLPGIGPVIAQRIIDYREQYGPFTHLSQLTLVEGIGEKRLSAIIDLITLE